jgi:hypothetical protein
MLSKHLRFISFRVKKNIKNSFSTYYPKPHYLLSDVKNEASVLDNYVSDLNSLCPAPLYQITDYAKKICDGLNVTNAENENIVFKHNDKGMVGKYVESEIFGIIPNRYSLPDLPNGYDIKTTHAKTKYNLYSAKERLTITNCGNKNNYSSFQSITNSINIKDCRHYTKIQKGVLFVFLHESKPDLRCAPTIWMRNKTLLSILTYDLDRLDKEEMNILESDYSIIRDCIKYGNISQRNQQYLHIHKHGTKKNPNTCALGFTSKFLNKIIGVFGGKKMVARGKSYYFRLYR